MDDPKISVTLTSPAKIGGKHELPGKTVTVSHTLALQLAASGVIDPAAAQALSQAIGGTVGTSEFDAAVAEIQRQADERIAQFEASFKEKEELVARAMQHVETNYKVNLDTLSKALTDAEDHTAHAKADIENLTASLTTEANARAELEKQLSTANNRIAELEEIITSRGVAAEEAAEDATNTQKAGKKPAASKD